MMPALQEAVIKDWVGHTGIESRRMFALGASFLNLSIWKQDSESAISLQTPGIWITQTLMLLQAQK